jgi:hypothetical protein
VYEVVLYRVYKHSNLLTVEIMFVLTSSLLYRSKKNLGSVVLTSLDKLSVVSTVVFTPSQ